MGTKGRSNLYGKGKRGKTDNKIGYKYARIFSNKHLESHLNRHAYKEMGLNERQYKAKAKFFANKVDLVNHDSFVKFSKKTLKFSYKTKEFVVVDNDGIIETYYRTSPKWWEREKKKHGK